jgi:hypothetical protein
VQRRTTALTGSHETCTRARRAGFRRSRGRARGRAAGRRSRTFVGTTPPGLDRHARAQEPRRSGDRQLRALPRRDHAPARRRARAARRRSRGPSGSTAGSLDGPPERVRDEDLHRTPGAAATAPPRPRPSTRPSRARGTRRSPRRSLPPRRAIAACSSPPGARGSRASGRARRAARNASTPPSPSRRILEGRRDAPEALDLERDERPRALAKAHVARGEDRRAIASREREVRDAALRGHHLDLDPRHAAQPPRDPEGAVRRERPAGQDERLGESRREPALGDHAPRRVRRGDVHDASVEDRVLLLAQRDGHRDDVRLRGVIDVEGARDGAEERAVDGEGPFARRERGRAGAPRGVHAEPMLARWCRPRAGTVSVAPVRASRARHRGRSLVRGRARTPPRRGRGLRSPRPVPGTTSRAGK